MLIEIERRRRVSGTASVFFYALFAFQRARISKMNVQAIYLARLYSMHQILHENGNIFHDTNRSLTENFSRLQRSAKSAQSTCSYSASSSTSMSERFAEPRKKMPKKHTTNYRLLNIESHHNDSAAQHNDSQVSSSNFFDDSMDSISTILTTTKLKSEHSHQQQSLDCSMCSSKETSSKIARTKSVCFTPNDSSKSSLSSKYKPVSRAPSNAQARVANFNSSLFGVQLKPTPVQGSGNMDIPKNDSSFHSYNADFAQFMLGKDPSPEKTPTPSLSRSLTLKIHDSSLSKNHIRRLKETLKLDEIPYGVGSTQNNSSFTSKSTTKSQGASSEVHLPRRPSGAGLRRPGLNEKEDTATYRSSAQSIKLNSRTHGGSTSLNRSNNINIHNGSSNNNLGGNQTSDLESTDGNLSMPIRIVFTEKSRNYVQQPPPGPSTTPLDTYEPFYLQNKTWY
jgi:hypothetical protein